MNTHKKILIVKNGAFGDVVRTSFFAKPLHIEANAASNHLEIYWLTSPDSLPLLRFNPYIDHISTDFNDLAGIVFDTIYSLDDEIDILLQVSKLQTQNLVGAYLNKDGRVSYSEQSAYWFDMGLLSKYGKERADELKKYNSKTHSDIFKKIFQVSNVDFTFYNSLFTNENTKSLIKNQVKGKIAIGLNAFASKRWKSKALPVIEFEKIVRKLSEISIKGNQVHLFLIGSSSDLNQHKNYLLGTDVPDNISTINTDGNILKLASLVSMLKILVTSDSLCLHLAVGQKIPTVAFFVSTSAAEIENFPFIRKLKSLDNDYCSYKSDADNSSITSDRILEEVINLIQEL